MPKFLKIFRLLLMVMTLTAVVVGSNYLFNDVFAAGGGNSDNSTENHGGDGVKEGNQGGKSQGAGNSASNAQNSQQGQSYQSWLEKLTAE